jgi:hypothetical protein
MEDPDNSDEAQNLAYDTMLFREIQKSYVDPENNNIVVSDSF